MKRVAMGVAVGVLVGLLAGGGFVWATIPHSTSGEVTACYPTSGASKGALRVIDAQAGQACASGEAKVVLSSSQCSSFPRIRVDWHACDFRGTYLNYQYLPNSNLRATNFGSARMYGTNVSGSDLTNANLTGATLGTANLRGANVTGVTFTNARLSPIFTQSPAPKTGVFTVLAGVIGLTQAQLRGVAQRNVGICGQTGTAPELSWVDLGGLNLAGFDLHAVSFVYSSAVGTNLSGANLYGIESEYTNYSNANLSGANLTCSHLYGTNFTNANLSGANLSQVQNLGNATLTGVVWNNTTCPDDTNSDANGNTCIGHL